mgnify:CR=1 FL=1
MTFVTVDEIKQQQNIVQQLKDEIKCLYYLLNTLCSNPYSNKEQLKILSPPPKNTSWETYIKKNKNKILRLI